MIEQEIENLFPRRQDIRRSPAIPRRVRQARIEIVRRELARFENPSNCRDVALARGCGERLVIVRHIDELIRATHAARNRLINLENCTDEDLKEMQREFDRLRDHVKAESAGKPATQRAGS